MALTPIDETHALQIQAGTVGRNAGHKFENALANAINTLRYPLTVSRPDGRHVFSGDAADLLLRYVACNLGINRIENASAIATGALATSEEGKSWLSVNGVELSRCKSDIILTLQLKGAPPRTVGVSTKQCSNSNPTNAQLYFTTARGFVSLLRSNGLTVTEAAVRSLRQFCGDCGFQPSDNPAVLVARESDPRRYFWEETDPQGINEWRDLISANQDSITRLLLQKAYLGDLFIPDFLLHKTRCSSSWSTTEVAIYGIEELVGLSRHYQGFATRSYSVRKGSYRDPAGVAHLAPRFGVIQMQRGGQRQNPEQLQFNLAAGYFYRI